MKKIWAFVLFIILFILALDFEGLLAQTAPAVIFKGQYGKVLPSQGLEFKDNKYLISNSSNPSTGSVNAPIGSLLLASNGSTYVKQDAGLSTNWTALSLGQDTNVFHVGPANKYKTISAALTACGNSAVVADVKKPCTILIEPGAYDESLTIPLGRIVTLCAQGTVILGDGAGVNWASTTPRSITFSASNADVLGSDIKPALNIVAVPASDATSTFIMEAGVFRISGDLNITGAGLSHTVNLNSVRIDGTITKTATGLTNLQGYRWLNVGVVSAATSTILERCFECEFDALVVVDSFNSVTDSEFKAGLTVAANSNTLPPSGFFDTTFSGTFTGPASSAKFDPVSNYFFVQNGATLAGGATKVLQGLIDLSSQTTASLPVNALNGVIKPTNLGMTASGDLIYDNAGTASPIAIGTTSFVLTSNGTFPFWASIPAAGSGLTDPMTTRGDIIYRNSSNTTARLPLGTQSYALTSNGTDLVYASLPLYSDPLTTRGDVLFRNAANVTARLPIGAASFVLTSNGVDLAYASIPYPVGYVDPTTTAGDLLFRNASNVLSRLPIGPVSYPLISNGTIPVYASIPLYSDPLTTRGDVLIRNAANATARLGIGSASFVLTSNGTDVFYASIPYPLVYSDPKTTAGDMDYRNSSNINTRLPIGNASFIMTSNGSIPTWATSPYLVSPLTTLGDIIYQSGSATRLPIGTVSYVLTSNGSVPVWSAASSGASNTWYVDATIIGTSGQQELGTGSQTAWTVAADHTDFSLANASWSGTTLAQIACASGEVPSGATCSTNETLGIGFTPLSNCDFEVCSQFTHYMNTTTGVTTSVSNIDATFAIIETPSNAVTVTNLGTSHENSSFDVPLNASNRSDFGAPHTLCGSFQGRTTFSTFRIAYKKTADSNSNSNSILTFLGFNRGDANVRFKAHCLK